MLSPLRKFRRRQQANGRVIPADRELLPRHKGCVKPIVVSNLLTPPPKDNGARAVLANQIVTFEAAQNVHKNLGIDLAERAGRRTENGTAAPASIAPHCLTLDRT